MNRLAASKARYFADALEKNKDNPSAQEALINEYKRSQIAECAMLIKRAQAGYQFADFEKDDKPNIIWLSSTSISSRPEHAKLVNVVRPVSDPLWKSWQPGNEWGCKCSWATTNDEVTESPELPTEHKKGLKGNPHLNHELFSADYKYLDLIADDQLKDVTYFDNHSDMQIKVLADKTEIGDNVATGRILKKNFPDLQIEIRKHLRIDGLKNPEYRVNGMIADAKRIEGYNGISTGFNRAKKQKCKVVIVDFNKHFNTSNPFSERKLTGGIKGRHADFTSGAIKECYVVYGDKVVMIDKTVFETADPRNAISSILKQLMP